MNSRKVAPRIVDGELLWNRSRELKDQDKREMMVPLFSSTVCIMKCVPSSIIKLLTSLGKRKTN